MNPTTEILLLAFARDWYLDTACRYGGETGETLREIAEEINKHLKDRIEGSKGEKSGDSSQE